MKWIGKKKNNIIFRCKQLKTTFKFYSHICFVRRLEERIYNYLSNIEIIDKFYLKMIFYKKLKYIVNHKFNAIFFIF